MLMDYSQDAIDAHRPGAKGAAAVRRETAYVPLGGGVRHAGRGVGHINDAGAEILRRLGPGGNTV